MGVQNGRRDDDAFTRKVIWALISLVLGSVGGWIWTVAVLQTRVAKLEEQMLKFDAYYETLVEMKVMVEQLVVSSNERNELLKKFSTIQQQIYGEQQRRTEVIDNARKHMQDRGAHK